MSLVLSARNGKNPAASGLVLKNRIELDGLVADPLYTVVFKLEYVVAEPLNALQRKVHINQRWNPRGLRGSYFPYWLGPTCMVCPLAPLHVQIFHTAAEIRTTQRWLIGIHTFGNHHILVLVLPAWSVGGVLVPVPSIEIRSLYTALIGANDKINSDIYTCCILLGHRLYMNVSVTFSGYWMI